MSENSTSELPVEYKLKLFIADNRKLLAENDRLTKEVQELKRRAEKTAQQANELRLMSEQTVENLRVLLEGYKLKASQQGKELRRDQQIIQLKAELQAAHAEKKSLKVQRDELITKLAQQS